MTTPRPDLGDSNADSTLDLSLSLRLLFRPLQERRWLIGACVVASLIAAVVYLSMTPRMFQGHAVVQVQSAARKIVQVEDVRAGGELDKLEALKTIEFNLGRRELLQRLLTAHDISSRELGLDPDRTYTPDELTDILAERVSVSLVRGTRLITIDVLHEDPRRAAELANGLIAAYDRALVEQRTAVAGQANQFLMQEAERLRLKLDASEQALQQYKEQSNAVSLEQGQNVIVTQLTELTSKLTEAKTERLKLDAAVATLRGQEGMSLERMLSVSQIANLPQVAEQQRQLAVIQAEVARLEERYLERHPKLIEGQRQLKQIRANLGNAVTEAANSLITMTDAARQTEAKYAEALAEQERKALELNRLSIPFNAIARELASDSALFDAVVKRLKETDLTKSFDPGIIEVVERAGVPRHPVKPRRKLVLAGGAAGGLFLGLLGAFGIWAIDQTFRTVDQVETRLGVPVLTTLPRVRGERRAMRTTAGRSAGEASRNPILAESYRTLRTTLALQKIPSRIVLLTSSIPGEGKSFFAINYAKSLAAAGARTLLIDADLRLPAVETEIFGNTSHADGRQRGLSEVLQGRCAVQEAVAHTPFDHLDVLTSGALLPDPVSSLLSPVLADVLREVERDYEYVVIDSAPVLSVGDTLIMAALPVAMALVVEAGKTPRNAVSRALRLLQEAGANVAGVVFNGAPEHGGYYYHYSAPYAYSPAPVSAVLPATKPVGGTAS